jgi:methionyl-tRNA formyltransferase
MQMEAGLDTGPILLERSLDIAPGDTSATLFAKLTALGADCIVEALASLATLKPIAQSEIGVTYAKKIEKSEAPLDWSQSAATLERRIRAFDPFPGCETTVAGERLKIWRAAVCERPPNAAAGTIVSASREALVVACGEQALRITCVQRAGGRRISSAELLQSFSISTGQQCT